MGPTGAGAGARARTRTSSGRSSRPRTAPAGSRARAAARWACARDAPALSARRTLAAYLTLTGRQRTRSFLGHLSLCCLVEGGRFPGRGGVPVAGVLIHGGVAACTAQRVRRRRACSVCVSTRRRRLSSSSARVRHENGAALGPTTSAGQARAPGALGAAPPAAPSGQVRRALAKLDSAPAHSHTGRPHAGAPAPPRV